MITPPLVRVAPISASVIGGIVIRYRVRTCKLGLHFFTTLLNCENHILPTFFKNYIESRFHSKHNEKIPVLVSNKSLVRLHVPTTSFDLETSKTPETIHRPSIRKPRYVLKRSKTTNSPPPTACARAKKSMLSRGIMPYHFFFAVHNCPY